MVYWGAIRTALVLGDGALVQRKLKSKVINENQPPKLVFPEAVFFLTLNAERYKIAASCGRKKRLTYSNIRKMIKLSRPRF